MIETARRIELDGDNQLVSVEHVKMYEIKVGACRYVVPSGVASLISSLLEEITVQQARRSVDEVTIDRRINNRIDRILIGLSGQCGPNLLKGKLDDSAALPPGVECDGKWTLMDEARERARRALSGETGNVMEEIAAPYRME